MKTCLQCNVNIKPRLKFCSTRCSIKYNNIHIHGPGGARKGTGRGTPLCKMCSTARAKWYGSRFCIECSASRSLYHSDPTIAKLKEHYTDANHSTAAYSYIRMHGRSVICKNQKLPCTNCGYDKHTEVCHIKAISTFPDTARLSEINSPLNLIYLCPNCHWEFDNNILPLKFSALSVELRAH